MPGASADNLTVTAHRSLQAAILSCRLQPGEKLVISDLCKTLGVSLGAVREALSRLASEGLVTAEPQKGFRVAPISQEEIEDLTATRGLIEGHCLDRAIAVGDLKWETGIVSALYELSRIPLQDPGNPDRVNDAWTQAHARYHAALVAACDSPWLLRLREMLYARSERYRQISVPLDRRHRDIGAEHQAIADAVIARDTDTARRLLVDHLTTTTRILIEAKVVDAVPPPSAARRPERGDHWAKRDPYQPFTTAICRSAGTATTRTGPRTSRGKPGGRNGHGVEHGHHHMRDHRRHPHAVAVGRAAPCARRHRPTGARGRRGGRRHPAPPRARPPDRRADRRPGGVSPVPYQGCDAVINLTTGSPALSPEDRLAAALAFSPEMCSLNMGSMNVSFHDMGRKVTDWKFPWERQYIADSESLIFRNTFADIRRNYELLADHGTRFEHECYDIGHLYNLAHMADKGVARPPFFIQPVSGILGGIGADPDNVVFMKRTADRLFGGDYVWSVLGGNVRVGLGDSLFIRHGQLAASNAEQAAKIVRLLVEIGLAPATPAEARERLGLKGGDRTRI